MDDVSLVVGAESEEELVVAGIGVGPPSSVFSRYYAGQVVYDKMDAMNGGSWQRRG